MLTSKIVKYVVYLELLLQIELRLYDASVVHVMIPTNVYMCPHRSCHLK